MLQLNLQNRNRPTDIENKLWLPKGKGSESEVTQSCPTLWDPWTIARQAPPSMGFSRQEYWSGLPFPSPGDLPDPGMELVSPVAPALAGRFFTTEPPGRSYNTIFLVFFTPWVWLSRTVISACMWRCVGLSMRKMCSDFFPQGEVNQNCLPS